MNILGISAYYHDAAAAIIQNGKIIAAAQEERFTRTKHDASFPSNAVKFCLEYGGFTIDELDAVVFYDKPLLKFERLLETYYAFAPRGLFSFVRAIPVWLKEKMFLKKLIKDELTKVEDFDKKKLNLLFAEHHLSHAASAFYTSAFEQAAIITIDGVGEWSTASICFGKGKQIEVLKTLYFPHSIGLLYSAFTYWLGFRVNSGEYKLMGLAPFGNPDSDQVTHFVDIIKNKLTDIKGDGSVWLDQSYFNYATGLKMVPDKKWEVLFGFPRRLPEGELQQKHCDLALAIQLVTEEMVLNIAKEARALTGATNLCMAGGVALNCVSNGKLLSENIFDNIYIQPAAGDAGGALGAALAAHHLYFEADRIVDRNQPGSMQGTYLGPDFSNLEIDKATRRYDAVWSKFEDFDNLTTEVTELIIKGNVIGWFQGRMEFGPRALGNRSILGDAGNAEMQKKLNLKIKKRESFRPFAPSVLEQDVQEIFDLKTLSPFMLLVANLKKSHRSVLPENYSKLPLMDKLYTWRSDLPAITHVDFSARIQTVNKNSNQRYWHLLKTYKEKTGSGILVNTSFNVRGEPIVCTPEDAFLCFMNTEMDYLVMGNLLFDKKEQIKTENRLNPVHAGERLKMKGEKREKNLETSLIITTGLLAFWFVYETDWLLFVALTIGLSGIFLDSLAAKVTWFWQKISDLLGFVMPKILLSGIFFLLLTPMGMIYRLFNKNVLQLKRKGKNGTYWAVRNYQYGRKDLGKPW